MTMLFLLLPIKTGKGTPWENMYDMQYGAVVRANSEKEAREMVSNKSGDEGPEVWLDPASVSCELLNHDGEFGVILQDFLAG